MDAQSRQRHHIHPHSSTPAASSGIIVVGTASDREAIIEVNSTTGAEVWSHSLAVRPLDPDPVWASPTIHGRTVLIQNGGYIWALDLFGNGDGTTSVKWGPVDLDRCFRRVLTDIFRDMTPVVIEGRVYAVTTALDVDRADTTVVCLDFADGSVLWSDCELGVAPFGSPVAFSGTGPSECLVSLDQNLYAYDQAGNRRTVANNAWGTPAVAGNSIYCLRNTDLNFDIDLLAIDGDGSVLWQYDRAWSMVKEDPICDASGDVVFGCTDGSLVCIDGSGAGGASDILWEKALDGDPVGKAAAASDSVSFVISRSWNDKVYSFTADTPNDPPTVAITAPNASGSFAGIIAVTASANDDQGVAWVQFQYSTDQESWHILPAGSQDDPANDARDWYEPNGWGFDFDTVTADADVGFAGDLNAAQVWVRARAVDSSGYDSGWDECDAPFTVDNEAPSAPNTLTVIPSGWSAANVFSVSWNNPSDLSGIAGAYYKVGTVPSSPTDGTYADGTTSVVVNMDTLGLEGEHQVYVWLKDNAGNVDHTARSQGTIRYDDTPPGNVGNLRSTSHTVGACAACL